VPLKRCSVSSGASAALGFAAGVAGITRNRNLFGKVEIDATTALITNKFEETNQQINQLSDPVDIGFDNIRRDVADNELDLLMASLQAIAYAYQEMRNTRLLLDAPTMISNHKLINT
jgi:hypothetical protein